MPEVKNQEPENLKDLIIKIVEEDILKKLFPAFYEIIKTIFGNTDEFKVIQVLFSDPHRKLSLLEISNQTGINYKNFTYRDYFKGGRSLKCPGKMRIFLEELVKKGYLLKEERGKDKQYGVNMESVSSKLIMRIMRSGD